MDAQELETVDRLAKLVESCLLPPLQSDIGSEHLASNHFDSFRQQLNVNLGYILDTLHDHPSLLLPKDSEPCIILHSRLLLLVCEQTALHATYSTDQMILMQSIQSLRNEGSAILWTSKAITSSALRWYEQRLNGNLWLRNMGAAHGFVTFCMIHYDGKNLPAMFLLAVGTLLMENYDHVYKELGLNVFSVLLQRMHAKDLLTLNIHEAIYRQCFHNVGNLKGTTLTHLLWQCLLDALAIMECWPKLFPAMWSELDDIMEALLRRIAFESDAAVRLLLITVLTMVAELPHTGETNRRIDTSPLVNWTAPADRCKSTCEASFRWTKKLLQIFNHNLSDGFYQADEFKLHLRAVHKCYLTCLYGIPVSLLGTAFEEFLSDFPPLLLVVAQRHRSKLEVLKDICDMISTLQAHIQWSYARLSKDSKLIKRLATMGSVKDALTAAL